MLRAPTHTPSCPPALQCEQLEKAKAGLEEAGMGDMILGGNYVCGVALGKVVDHGYELAQVRRKHTLWRLAVYCGVQGCE